MAGGTKGQRFVPKHIGQGQAAVEVGEEGAAARRFPFQRRAKAGAVERQQHQIALGGEVFRGGFGDLGGGGKMDVAIAQVHRRTGCFAGVAQGHPFGAAEDFVDQHGGSDSRDWVGAIGR